MGGDGTDPRIADSFFKFIIQEKALNLPDNVTVFCHFDLAQLASC